MKKHQNDKLRNVSLQKLEQKKVFSDVYKNRVWGKKTFNRTETTVVEVFL